MSKKCEFVGIGRLRDLYSMINQTSTVSPFGKALYAESVTIIKERRTIAFNAFQYLHNGGQNVILKKTTPCREYN